MLEDLILRWRAGDEAAAAELYNQFRLPLFRLAYGLLGDQAEAEDVMQESLRYALAHIDRYDADRALFSTWLHTIAVSRARDRQRRTGRWQGLLAGLTQLRLSQSLPSPELLLAQREQQASVLAAVRSLPPPQRELIVLRYWAGHSFPEISQIVGRSEGTVKSRLRLAHTQLRRLLVNQSESEAEHERTSS